MLFRSRRSVAVLRRRSRRTGRQRRASGSATRRRCAARRCATARGTASGPAPRSRTGSSATSTSTARPSASTSSTTRHFLSDKNSSSNASARVGKVPRHKISPHLKLTRRSVSFYRRDLIRRLAFPVHFSIQINERVDRSHFACLSRLLFRDVSPFHRPELSLGA